LGFAVKLNYAVTALIQQLLTLRDPSAIIWRVAGIIVTAV